MPGIAMIGAQWGDEGKGKVVDALAAEADFVVRYSGGANAGHTVVVGGEVFKLHHLPCGTLHDRPTSVLGGGMVIDPWTFMEELDALSARRDPGRVLVSTEAHLVLPHHKKNDEGGGFVGTTGRGIGPAYSDKARRIGVRAGDLLDDELLRERLARLIEAKPNSTARVGWSNVADAMAELAGVRERLAPLVADTGALVRSALGRGERVLFEGGQGTMLDLAYGTYPYVTSSHPSVGGILVGAGVSHKALGAVYGVVKAFTSRVGHGPFPTEITEDAMALRLRGSGSNQWDEYGTTTGRPRRVGWLDLPQLEYACAINGFDGLVVTKLDVLSGLDEVRVAVEHGPDGPVYAELPGWGELRGLGSREALPREVLDYLALIEERTGVPVSIFSTSPDREDTYGAVAW
ncbi:MAG: adenylosuccinate synthase [Trueperaceae bacterium]|nr:adenylosuccinate synthase [Trueperaceae bacterium]MCC6310370.1 adenylosuccinate synthase [Trueperaceae bacterium]MCO5174751.1 adenylosuccinate synthase [Trueperaceae bacterium]MCW5820591.1 adenylosuccinate synthase [Trueperaceae bacterium]